MSSSENKQSVLFICTHNSARSQMAEGFLRELYGNTYDAFSAGTHPSRVNPYAIEVMKEKNIDISHHTAKSIDQFREMEFDYVITVCDGARETCPVFPNGKECLHKRFEDPTQGRGDEEAKRTLFRRVRDEINNWVVQTFGNRDV
jgi:arsenate reductase